ncbi:anthranilate synthase component II [Garciella nitratireducens]|uniref:Anthranilate synthase component 2 n=1 Tax=Garciella nitratireducens DSM 15102 TaxID=1121911 RepID=A0A1T4NXB3_9FIRM|nr:aminodeoxychorismate/anthranilate synthase component II [Garciella nitratireducens]RBP46912.1 anthranilate synthase component 2 [Garciella nitratireducens]SJZ83873.1 anthranilate synthase component 2 [Garciella nitratireducens DSM 15102]
MLLLIDNYDSFTFNLYQMMGVIYKDIKVVRNDKITLEEMENMDLDGIVISPGPGRPEEAGICIEGIKKFASQIPILGICLGHQAIGCAFGGRVIGAEKIMHGKISEISVKSAEIFKELPTYFTVMRYHSLVMEKNTLPKDLEIIAQTKEGVIMAIKHKDYPLYGLQFHPESILTEYGDKILKNFIEGICHVRTSH